MPARRLPLAAFLAFAAIGACRASPPEPDPAAGAASSNAPCTAGFTKIASLGFCIQLPAGFAPGRPSEEEPGSLRIQFQLAGGMESFVVRATDGALDEVPDTYLDPAKNRIRGKGELASGKGKWFYSMPRGGRGATIGVYVQGPKKLYTCEMAGSEDGPEFQRTLDACKTITPLSTGPEMETHKPK
jgi:hypothetical protein